MLIFLWKDISLLQTYIHLLENWEVGIILPKNNTIRSQLYTHFLYGGKRACIVNNWIWQYLDSELNELTFVEQYLTVTRILPVMPGTA